MKFACLTALTICLLSFYNKTYSQTPGIVSGSIYTLHSKANGRVLNVINSAPANSIKINTWTDTQSDAERWRINYLGNSLYSFINVGTGKFLHLSNAKISNGVSVEQYDNTNDNSVKWAITDVGGSTFTIKSALDLSYAVDLHSTDLKDGVNVQIWKLNDSTTQKWSLNLETSQEMAPSAAIAEKVFDSWSNGYDIVNSKGFWATAEMMEITLDAYEVTGNAKYRAMFDQMYLNFIKNNGSDWMGNKYNDDITWISIACVRGFLLTGNAAYLNKAKDQFDKMYVRANTSSYGGGLLWCMGQTAKNSCINGPAMVACCYLAQATGDSSYYTKARTLYNWSKLYLFDVNTGKVNDNYDGGTPNTWSSTYNQGTYLGASVMLYNYFHDPLYLATANKIAQFTKVNMFNSDIMNNEEVGNDLPGFKGIFMRYARKYIVDCNVANYIPWLQLNAKIAFNNRNSRNIMSTQWATKTLESTSATDFSASTAVSLMFNCPYNTTLIKDAYKTIEAEHFDYLRGVITEPCPEGTENLGGVQNGFYTGYYNVDFGSKGAVEAQIRLSSLSAGNAVEIRLGSPTGIIIGTTQTINTGSWATYTTLSCSINNVKGLHNVYLVYKGSGYIANVNSFTFSETKILTGLVSNTNINPLRLELYPNPATKSISIKADNGVVLKQLIISDIYGRIVFQFTGNPESAINVDIDGFCSGLYFVKILTGAEEILSGKFVK